LEKQINKSTIKVIGETDNIKIKYQIGSVDVI